MFLEELAWRVKIRKQIEKWDKLPANVKPSYEDFAVGSMRECSCSRSNHSCAEPGPE
jgi:hypothetical protein